MGVPPRAGAKLYVQRHELRPTPRSMRPGKMRRTYMQRRARCNGQQAPRKLATVRRITRRRVRRSFIPLRIACRFEHTVPTVALESCHGAWCMGYVVRCMVRAEEGQVAGSAGHAAAPIDRHCRVVLLRMRAPADRPLRWTMRGLPRGAMHAACGRRVAAQQDRAQASRLSSLRALARRGRRASVSSRHSAQAQRGWRHGLR